MITALNILISATFRFRSRSMVTYSKSNFRSFHSPGVSKIGKSEIDNKFLYFDLEDMNLHKGWDSESEEEIDLRLHDNNLDSKENSSENSILNIVYLNYLVDCPIICWSIISGKYEVFLKAFDFSTAYL